ncbi:MAG: hypothetical protein QHG99_02200 [Methanomicrobiales archaeon]|nr:hypothetical protein [Methanomicrobiales archaeon]
MAMECPKIAKLSEDQLGEIRKMEKKMGIILIAYEKIPSYKKLAPDALKKIQSLEKDTGSILVAYEA